MLNRKNRAVMIGQLTENRPSLGEVVEHLELSVRQMRRLLARYRARASLGLILRHWGMPETTPWRKRPVATPRRVEKEGFS